MDQGQSKITFTIVTPSYNQGQFIGETIESVISQEGDFFIEYLIMDGGSTDDSVEVIKKYDRMLKDGKWPVKCRGIEYRWVSEKDKGQTDAIEKGFAAATGEIGAWLNSDDIYSDNRVLERVLKEFREDQGLMMVTGDGLFIDRDGKELGPHRVKEINPTALLYLDYHILQPATFLRKALYKKERLDLGYNYCFDAEYFIRIIDKGYRFKKLDSNLACFRFYPEIKTIAGAPKRFSESLRISRIYGKRHLLYAASAIYKYVDIVLKNKHPKSSLIKSIHCVLQAFLYRLLTGKGSL